MCGDLCVDLANDPNNCGACAHACPATSVCLAGACGPTATNVVAAAPGCDSLQLALSGGTLYWTDRGHRAVKSLRLAGAAQPTTISLDEKSPRLIEANGSHLAWIDVVSEVRDPSDMYFRLTTTARVRLADVWGGAPVDLVTETNISGGIRGIAFSDDGGTLYYSSDTKVKAVPVTGGAPIEVGHEDRGGIPMALGVEGTVVGYITDLNGTVDAISVKAGQSATCDGPPPDPTTGRPLMIDCVRVGGCTPEALSERFIVRGGYGYWADGGAIVRGSLVGGPFATKDLVTWTTHASGIAAGPDAIYFGDDSSYGDSTLKAGVIARAAYEPRATATPLVRGQGRPHALVVGPTMVYWATNDCEINAAAR